jgi:hypothetical protein
MYEMLHGSDYERENLENRERDKGITMPNSISVPSSTPRSHRSYPAKTDLDTVIKRCLREVEPHYASTDELLGDLRKIGSEKIDYTSTLAHLVHNVDVFAQEGSTTDDTNA